MQANPPGPGARRPLKLPQGARGPQPVRNPAPPQQGAGLTSAQRNELIEELATLAEGGSSNPDLLQYATGKGLDRENAIALIKRAKRTAQQRQAGDLPPGMGGGEPGYSAQPYQMQAGGHAQHANAGYPQGQYQTSHYGVQSAAQVGSLNTRAIGGIGIGVLLIVIGIGATAYSYSNAGPGESYTLWWGPVVFGVISFFGGIGGLFKK